MKALANAVHQPPSGVYIAAEHNTIATATSDSVFANSFDNAGSQCPTLADCPDSGNQCSASTCDAGVCGVSNANMGSTCNAGGLCNGGSSYVCDGSDSRVNTCSNVGVFCRPKASQCQADALCNGLLCPVNLNLPDGTPCNNGNGNPNSFCKTGVCFSP